MRPLFRGAAAMLVLVLGQSRLAGNDPAAHVRLRAGALAEAAAAAGSTTVLGQDGWLFFAPELRHLAAGQFWGEAAASISRATKPEHADPLPAILDFKSQLDAAGITLLFVPVPPKAVIYPEHIFRDEDLHTADLERLDTFHQEFYALLREHGVTVIDLVPTFQKNKTSIQLYCRQDTHWSGAACVLAAKVIAAAIGAPPWLKTNRGNVTTELTRATLVGDLTRGLETPPPAEELELRTVGIREGDALAPVAPDPASPVVLLGDSHNLVFHAGGDMHAVGAGLPDQLAAELGIAVDLVAVRGSGATPARINLLRRARNPDYLAGKKVLIWCFAAREFTESPGWQKVPVVPAPR